MARMHAREIGKALDEEHADTQDEIEELTDWYDDAPMADPFENDCAYYWD